MKTAPRPLVSVVLPTRDRPDRLIGALASVLAQSYPDLEVVVVDDASRVRADETVRELASDPRVDVVRLDRPSGAAAARNAGIARSSGEIVAFLDDDDRWEPDKVRRQVDAFAQSPEAALVSCHHFVVDERPGARPSVHRGPTTFTAAQVQWMNFPGSFSFVAARRATVGDELWLDESFPSVEDWDLWLRCMRHGPAVVVPEPLCRLVVHGGAHLSAPASEHRGLERFIAKHGDGMPPVCRRYAMAHVRMLQGDGWAKRAGVLRSLATGSPRASAVLAVEQLARQLGRAKGDPGLVERAMARVVGPDGRASGLRARPAPADDSATVAA
ncbi:MAG TPA: glycosyltransferase [Acidimicrobiales bacterium]|nr:glycosyltransferase [Acidimicrobiales bacterium]